MNYRIYFLLFWLLYPIAGFSQITQQQARPIDSALVVDNLDLGLFHARNYHGVTFPPGGYWTWDAGCGIYEAIDDYFLAWSHTGMVADTIAACLDTMPCQAYRLFNLDSMANTDAYRDSVELWLSSLGIPVNIWEVHKWNFHVWPNPMSANSTLNITCPLNGDYVLTIVNLLGEVVFKISGSANKYQNKSFDLTHLKKGSYILYLEINKQIFTTQLIKSF